MASTYPLEIVQADRWARSNKSLKGDALKAAVEKQPWDETVKSLVATPQVLATMSEQIDWTERLGNAVLAQQNDLMAAVQRLRLKAKEAGYLKTTKEQTVTVESAAAASEGAPAAGEAVPSGGGAVAAGPSQVVVIQSTQPAVVTVPFYDPGVVYGGWAYPSYPPYFWPPAAGYYGYYPGWYPGQALVAGVSFGLGVAWVGAVTGAFNWGHGEINVGQVNVGGANVTNTVNFQAWQHNPLHRGGVSYTNSQVAQRFSKANAGALATGGAAAGAAALQGKAGAAALQGKAGTEALKSKLGGPAGGNPPGKPVVTGLPGQAGTANALKGTGSVKLHEKPAGAGNLQGKAGGNGLQGQAGANNPKGPSGAKPSGKPKHCVGPKCPPPP
jgi:hypothetical protein